MAATVTANLFIHNENFYSFAMKTFIKDINHIILKNVER